MPPRSITQQAHDKGFDLGWSQAMQVSTDDAFARGQLDAWHRQPSRIRWFIIGLITAAVLAAWLG